MLVGAAAIAALWLAAAPFADLVADKPQPTFAIGWELSGAPAVSVADLFKAAGIRSDHGSGPMSFTLGPNGEPLMEMASPSGRCPATGGDAAKTGCDSAGPVIALDRVDKVRTPFELRVLVKENQQKPRRFAGFHVAYRDGLPSMEAGATPIPADNPPTFVQMPPGFPGEPETVPEACWNTPVPKVAILPLFRQSLGPYSVCRFRSLMGSQPALLIGQVDLTGMTYQSAGVSVACRNLARAWVAVTFADRPPLFVVCVAKYQPFFGEAALSPRIYERLPDGRLADATDQVRLPSPQLTPTHFSIISDQLRGGPDPLAE